MAVLSAASAMEIYLAVHFERNIATVYILL